MGSCQLSVGSVLFVLKLFLLHTITRVSSKLPLGQRGQLLLAAPVRIRFKYIFRFRRGLSLSFFDKNSPCLFHPPDLRHFATALVSEITRWNGQEPPSSCPIHLGVDLTFSIIKTWSLSVFMLGHCTVFIYSPQSLWGRPQG